MNRNLSHRLRVVSRLILGHIIEVIGSFFLQAADGEGDVLPLGHGNLPVLECVHTGRHLEFGVVAAQIHLSGLSGQGLGVLLPLLHHHPVQSARLVQVGIQPHRGGIHLIYCRVGIEAGRCTVYGGKGHLFDGGTLPTVHVGEPQVQVVGLQLLQRDVVHVKCIGDVLGHIEGSKAQIAADGVGLKVVGRGGGRPLGQHRPVQPAGLGGHGRHLPGGAGDFGHIGVTGGEIGHGVVRRSKGDDLQRAPLLPRVHKDGGQVIGAVGGQAADFDAARLAGAGQAQGAALDNLGAVGRGVEQIVHPHGAVGHRGDRPIDGTLLIGAEPGGGAGGRQIRDLRVARQQPWVRRGLRRRFTVHLLPVDGGLHAGPDSDLIRQHRHRAARGVDGQVADVPVAGHGGGHVQVHVVHLSARGNVQSRIRGFFVHVDGIHMSAGDANTGLGRQVRDLLDIARQVEGKAVLPLQGNLAQAVPRGGAVVQIGVGAHAGMFNDPVALHADGNLLVGDVVHNQLGRVHIAQHNAVVSALAHAAAADDDLPQHGHILQRDLAQIHAARYVEVAAHHGIPQGDAGARNGYIAPGAPQAVDSGCLHRGAHGLYHQDRRLSAGNLVLGAEAAVRVAVHQAVPGCRGNIAPAPLTQLPAVGKAGVLAGIRLQHQISGEDNGRLLPGNAAVGGKGGLGRAGNIALRIGDIHILRIPGGIRHILEGIAPQLLIAQRPVDHRHKLRPRNGVVRSEVPRYIPPHKAPIHHLLQIGVCIGCPGLARQLREQPQQQDACQQGGAYTAHSSLPEVHHRFAILSLALLTFLPYAGTEG